ncbi:MAG TPA: pseudouridine synthase [Tepidisphaeraceae bacterium]|nr:pseudouridine synthase [Tepidisphaeraceae bacterium]
MKERIQKVLANAGVASRRSVEEMIRQGRVAVNGTTMTELPILINPAKDKVTVDEEPVKLVSREGKESTERFYLLMNKPKGVVSTNVAQGEQTRAIDLLPPGHPRVYPVGRLDAESKGLLFLTNDGELTNRLTHPRYGVPKTYRAVVDGFVTGEVIEELGKGVWLADRETGAGFKTARTMAKVVKRGRDSSVLEVTLREGRNRQVRRMLAKLGHKVRDLTRVRMGPLTLEGLNVGHVRALTPREVKELKKFGQEVNERAAKRAETGAAAAHTTRKAPPRAPRSAPSGPRSASPSLRTAPPGPRSGRPARAGRPRNNRM